MVERTRKSAETRRVEIVTALLRIVGERGVQALTTANLAAEVGLTTGALFRHFDSLEAMWHEATHYAVEQIDATFPEESLPPQERLLKLARNRVRLLGGDAGIAWLMRSEQAYLVLPAEAMEALQLRVTRSRKFILKALKDGAAEGVFREDIEPELLIVPVMGTIHTLIGMTGVHRGAAGRKPSTERVLDALMQLLAPHG